MLYFVYYYKKLNENNVDRNAISFENSAEKYQNIMYTSTPTHNIVRPCEILRIREKGRNHWY